MMRCLLPRGIVLPAEGDLGVGDREQAMVGDGDAMSITSEIVDLSDV